MYFKNHSCVNLSRIEYNEIKRIVNSGSMEELKEFVKSKLINGKAKKDNELITSLATTLHNDFVKGYLEQYIN